jgi:hypothetical protein
MVGLYDARLLSLGLVLSTVIGAALVLLARWRGWYLPEPYNWRPRAPHKHAGARSDPPHGHADASVVDGREPP